MAGKRIMKIKKKGVEEPETQETPEISVEPQEQESNFDDELKKMMIDSLSVPVVPIVPVPVNQVPIQQITQQTNSRVPIPVPSNRPSTVTSRRAF